MISLTLREYDDEEKDGGPMTMDGYRARIRRKKTHLFYVTKRERQRKTRERQENDITG